MGLENEGLICVILILYNLRVILLVGTVYTVTLRYTLKCKMRDRYKGIDLVRYEVKTVVAIYGPKLASEIQTLLNG